MGGGLRQHSSSTRPTSTEIERSAHQEAINLGEGVSWCQQKEKEAVVQKGGHTPFVLWGEQGLHSRPGTKGDRW